MLYSGGFGYVKIITIDYRDGDDVILRLLVDMRNVIINYYYN